MKTIINPILPGFHPDPSIIRVEEDYYIAVSTFEWFPGVCIYHSRDLQNWELIARPLERTGQLDMRGNGCVGRCLCSVPFGMIRGLIIWSILMSVHTGMNLWTARTIWSRQKISKDRGLIRFIFTVQDRFFFVSRYRWKEISGRSDKTLQERQNTKNNFFRNTMIKKKRLIGKLKEIYAGSGISIPEGPHLYKKGGYYYLLTAEGGTEYGHAVTMARSRNIEGPYELHPGNPILTSRDNLRADLQKAGHADLVETPDGQWYMVHLCARPLPLSGDVRLEERRRYRKWSGKMMNGCIWKPEKGNRR